MKKLSATLLALLISTQAFALSDESAKSAISNFYKNYVFGRKDLAENTKLGTKKFLKKLQDAYEYDCEQGPCYAAYALRTGFQDGNGSSKVVSISPKGKGWYRVEYRDMGHKGVTDVKVVEANGAVKLDDFKSISETAQ